MSGPAWGMQKASLVRCEPPFWMALRPPSLRSPQGWPSACDLLAMRYWFAESWGETPVWEGLNSSSTSPGNANPLQSWVLMTYSHCSSAAAACWWCLCHGNPSWLVRICVEFTARDQPCLAYRDKHFQKYWNGKITAGVMPSHLSCYITVSVFDYWSHKGVIFFMLLKQLQLLYLICPFRREQE